MQIFYYMTSILDIKPKKPPFHDEYTRYKSKELRFEIFSLRNKKNIN